MTPGNGNKRLLLIMGVVVALGLVFTAVHADDGVMFGYKFEEGTSLDYKVKFTQEMDFGNFANSQFMDFEVTEKCVGVNEDGKYSVEVAFIKAESSRMQFDKMAEDKSYESLVDQSITFQVDAHGAVTDIKVQGYVENWTTISPNIIMMMQMWYPYLSGEQVAKGDGWQEKTDKVDNGAGMIISTSSDFSFEDKKKEKGRECAKVTADVKQIIEGAQAGYTADGTGTGNYEFLFDPNGSVIVTHKSKFEIKMDMTPESGKGDVVETTINIQMERVLL